MTAKLYDETGDITTAEIVCDLMAALGCPVEDGADDKAIAAAVQAKTAELGGNPWKSGGKKARPNNPILEAQTGAKVPIENIFMALQREHEDAMQRLNAVEWAAASIVPTPTQADLDRAARIMERRCGYITPPPADDA